MKASAEVSLEVREVRVIQVRRTGKGCLSYVIGDGERAFIIDASLDPQVYLTVALHQGWQVTSVLETHIHADHLSCAGQLAKLSGATLYLSDQQWVSFPFTALRDGTTVEAGRLRLSAIHTPGHTAESTRYLLGGQVLFTGDSLFPTGVGRPDLDASQEEAHVRAEARYQSVHKLLALPASTLLLAGTLA